MKLALDRKKLHLRFVCGTGFALYLITRGMKKDSPDKAEKIKSIAKQAKKLLKDFKRKNGAINLVEVESKDTRIRIRI